MKVLIIAALISLAAARQICEPRKQFKDYCNTCFCSDDGLTYSCTRMMCDKEIWNRDGSLKIQVPEVEAEDKPEVKQICEPRKPFKDYCNTCFCSDDGTSYSCTRMMCDRDIWNRDGTLKIDIPESTRVVRSASTEQVCEPRKQFKDYCNTCACASDGLSFACTRMMCDEKIWNRDGTLKIKLSNSNRVAKSATSEKQVCEPRKQFKNFCNTCACASDGLSFACTRMMCDQEIWNKDGSLKIKL